MGAEQVSVRLAECTHGWADHSGDSDARSLPTNCQKANDKTVSALEMSTSRVCRCVCGWQRGVSQPARCPLGGQAGACGSEMTLILDE